MATPPLRTALTLIPFTVGVALGSAFAPRLIPAGRRVVMLGCLVMAAGMGVITMTLAHYAATLEPWHLTSGMVISGLGMPMVGATLLNIVLARVPATASGAASSLLTTSMQVGTASGGVIGTVYLSLVAVREPCTDSTVVGTHLLASVAALVPPPGPTRLSDDDPAPSGLLPALRTGMKKWPGDVEPAAD